MQLAPYAYDSIFLLEIIESSFFALHQRLSFASLLLTIRDASQCLFHPSLKQEYWLLDFSSPSYFRNKNQNQLNTIPQFAWLVVYQWLHRLFPVLALMLLKKHSSIFVLL